MKKLLLGLGTLAAVAAPVAAVVACGSSKSESTKFATYADFTQYANAKGYKIALDDNEKSKIQTFVNTIKGFEVFKEATMGTNDHLILIKGTPSEVGNGDALDVSAQFTKNGATSATDTTSVLARWKLAQTDFAQADYAISLQTSSNGVKSINLMKVVKMADNKFGMEMVQSFDLDATGKMTGDIQTDTVIAPN